MANLNITNFELMCRMLNVDAENEFRSKYTILFFPYSYKLEFKANGILVHRIMYIIYKELDANNNVKVEVKYFDSNLNKLSEHKHYFNVKLFKEGFKILVAERIKDIE